MNKNCLLLISIIILLSLLINRQANSQETQNSNIDIETSIQNIWKKSKNLNDLKTNIQYRINNHEIDINISDIQFLLEKVIENKNDSLLGIAYMLMGDYNTNRSRKFSAAIDNYYMANKHLLKIYDKIHITINMGLNYYYSGDYTKAMKKYTAGIKMVNANKEKLSSIEVNQFLIKIYNNISMIHIRNINYELSLDFSKKAKLLSEKTNYFGYSMILINMIKSIYMKEKDLNEISVLINECRAVLKKENKLYDYGIFLFNIGGIYTVSAKKMLDKEEKRIIIKKAHDIFNETLGIIKKTNSTNLTYFVNANKGVLFYEEYYLNPKQKYLLDSAYYYLNLAQENSEKGSSTDLEILSNFEKVIKKIIESKIKKTTNKKDLYYYYKKLDGINYQIGTLELSLLNAKTQKEIINQTYKIELENKELKAQNEQELREKAETILYISISMTIVLLILLLIIVYEIKKKKATNHELKIVNRQLEKSNIQIIEKSQQLEKSTMEIEEQHQELIIKTNELNIAKNMLEEFNSTLEFKIDEQKIELEETNRELSIIDASQSNLLDEMGTQKRDLLNHTMVLAEKNNFLEKLKRELTGVNETNDESIESIQVSIEDEIRFQEYWSDFEKQFKTVDYEFSKKLSETFANLTEAESRICQLIKLNLKTKEISNVLNLSNRTVETHRTNIRKKMDLKKGANLTRIIKNM